MLAAGGVLFSGYLSAVKLFTKSCAFNESCPYFLGYPACFYGFGFFFILFIVSLFGVLKRISGKRTINILFFVSLLGIIFSGSFTAQEISTGRLFGTLGLSTCAYGLFFFVAVFVLSCIACRKNN